MRFGPALRGDALLAGVEDAEGEPVLPRGGAGGCAELPQQLHSHRRVLVFAQHGLHLLVFFRASQSRRWSGCERSLAGR